MEVTALSTEVLAVVAAWLGSAPKHAKTLGSWEFKARHPSQTAKHITSSAHTKCST
jgi:hypothetical protein